MKQITYLLSLLILTGCAAGKIKSENPVFKTAADEKNYYKAYDKTLDDWPVPYTEKDIPTTFGTAHVIIAGPANGEPLVLMHGMNASSTMWYANVKAFTKKYRIYAVDYLTETGKSIGNGHDLDNAQMVQWYNEVFDALGIKNFYLLGTSRGGWLATKYTLAELGRVKKLALISPVQTFNNVSMGIDTRNAATFTFFPSRKSFKSFLNTMARYPEKMDDSFKEQIYRGAKYAKSDFAMIKMKPFTDDELQTLTLPVLVLIGDHDILNPPDVVEKAGKILPDVNAALIDDAGHFLNNDQQEEVDKRVMEFLTKK